VRLVSDSVTRGVLVTGGADGIGEAIARRYLAGGMRVHICDVRREAIDSLCAEHGGISASVADVGVAQDVTRMFAEAQEALGSIAVLVNNVGIGGPRALIEKIAMDEWDRTFAVNVGGMLRCMQAVIPQMKARRSGAIINISTASTRTRLPSRTAYIASKFAVEGLTLNAARELGPFGIRCNAILPGIMNNARMDEIIATRAAAEGRDAAEIEQEYLSHVSLRCRTEREDVAEAAFYLASAAAARVTGELLSVSGNLEWET
jgi:NAD(P)-dependent dehydrogenase (short-subunit alcohol dehydrogenase family)